MSKFSRKIILREKGVEPVRVRRADPLSDQLRTQRTASYVEEESTETRLDASITLDVGKPFAALLTHPRCNASLALHRAHLSQMLSFVWTLSFAAVPARTALRTFFEMYDIEEDDYAFESAYRLYVRHKAQQKNKNMQKCGNFFPRGVATNSRFLADLKPAVTAMPDEARLNDICAEIEQHLLEMRLRKKCRPAAVPRTLLRQAKVYVFAQTGRRHYKLLAKKFGVSKSQIYRDIERVSDFLRYDPDFAAAMRPAVLKPRPTTGRHSSAEATAARPSSAHPYRNFQSTTPKNGAAPRAAARLR